MDMIEIVIPMEVAISQVEIPMDVAVSEEEIPMAIDIAYNMVSGDWYDGPYEVTPRLYQQSLATDNKLMQEDVTVHQIPVVYTSNPFDGQTVVIG